MHECINGVARHGCRLHKLTKAGQGSGWGEAEAVIVWELKGGDGRRKDRSERIEYTSKEEEDMRERYSAMEDGIK